MNLLRRIVLLPFLSLPFLLAGGAASAQHPTFAGSASANGVTTLLPWIYDTGAAVTSMNAGSAAAIGLVPGRENGAIRINGVPALCFNNVQITCIDSDAQACNGKTTVYVILGGPLRNVNLLGKDIRKKLKGKWDDDTEKLHWSAPNTPVGPFLLVKAKSDPVTTQQLYVADGVVMKSSSASVSVSMTVLSEANRSFVPASVAAQLGAPVLRSVDLSVEDPDTLLSLEIAGQNNSGQTVFDEIQLNSVDIGLGPVSGTVKVLVNPDENSGFATMGRDLRAAAPGSHYVYMEVDKGSVDYLAYYPL